MTEENHNVNEHGSEQVTATESTTNNKKILKWAGILLAIFIVTFCAVYFVVDMKMHRLGLAPFVEGAKQAEKMIEEAEKYIPQKEPVPLDVDEKADKYIITINLKPFDNDPNKIEIETQENGIKFSGYTEKKVNEQIQQTSYYQALIFPRNINKDGISKEHKGDKFVITIPFAK